jgi:hypothetical protein
MPPILVASPVVEGIDPVDIVEIIRAVIVYVDIAASPVAIGPSPPGCSYSKTDSEPNGRPGQGIPRIIRVIPIRWISGVRPCTINHCGTI